MIKNLRFIICLFACVLASVLTTEAAHALSRVERLSAEISIPYLDVDTCVTISYKGYPVVIERKDEEIAHIGITIFGNSLKNNSNEQIYRFIEQYLLELLTYQTKSDQAQRMFDDGVIIMGDLKDIPLLSSDEGIFLTETYEQGRGYNIEWSNGKSTFSMSFTPKYELISGLNKIELENQFVKRVRAHKITKEPSSYTGGDTIRISEDLFVVKNGFYILEQIECSKYLTYEKRRQKESKTNSLGKDAIDSLSTFNCLDSLTLVCDEKYPIESLRNLLSTSSIQNEYTISVKINKYGFKQEVFSVPLSQLIDFCLQEGCAPYVGIEKAEDETITAVLIMVQPNYGYNHIFKIEFNSETLQDKTGIIYGVVNGYTPTHNVSNLYGEDNNIN